MIKPNPFTPKSGLEPKVFFDREKEINFFLKRIDEAKTGNTNHYIINGVWGSGKTSLLRYFKLLAQGRNCYASYFLASEFVENTPDIDLSIHIIESIIRDMPPKLFNKNSNFLKLIQGFGIQMFGIGVNISLNADKNKIIDPQIFLEDGLLNIWKDISKHTDLLVVLVDDVQNFSKVQRIFTTLKNVLSNERIIKNTKILFILSSTIEGWKPFMKVNHPIGRYFIPRVELTNFDRENTIKLLDATLEGTGVVFSDSVKDKVFQYTNGHLFEIQALGSALYDNQKNGEVTDAEWDVGFEQGLLYLGNAVYDGIIEGLSPNEIKIIKNLKVDEVNRVSDISHKVGVKSINEYFRRLADKGILKVESRGEYYIEDRIFWEYVRRKSKKSQI